MSENKADPLREALQTIANHPENFDDGTNSYSVGWGFWNVQKIAKAALAAPQPAAPLGGREAIARMIRKALVENWRDDYDGRQWDEDVLLTGCRKVGGGMGYQKPEEAAQRLALDAADAILAAIPQELGDVERLLQDTLAEYERTVEAAEKDTALSDTGRQRVIECCLDARGVVKVFAARLLAQESARPALNIAAVPDLKTDPELLALIERSKNYVMTPAEMYEQQRSFLRGQCPLRRDYKEWCAEVDRLLPPAALAGKETDQ